MMKHNMKEKTQFGLMIHRMGGLLLVSANID